MKIREFFIGDGQPLAVMSGPCVIESESQSLHAAENLKKIFERHPVNYIFKSSYDKANRMSVNSYRGPGLQTGLKILEKIKREFDLPVVTDVHSPEEARAAAEVVDILQVPAFLCRQTDLIIAAAKTGVPVSIKKGQFLAPWDMAQVIDKARSTGNDRVIAVDRGVSFGYNNLVSDFRAIPIMQKMGVPVCFDATHSVQLPGGLGDKSGGQREFIPILAKAAIAAGADCLFMEAHANPKEAKSDAASMLDFTELAKLMEEILRLYDAVHG